MIHEEMLVSLQLFSIKNITRTLKLNCLLLFLVLDFNLSVINFFLLLAR